MKQLRSRLKWRLYFARIRVKLHVRRTMIEGVLLLVPIVVTFVVLRWVWGFVDGVLSPAIETSTGVSFPGLGVVALLVLVYLVGLVWEIDLGKRILTSAQKVLTSLPIVRVVYSPARQLIQSFSGSGASGFKRVVVIEYPRAGTWMLGFLTSITTRNDGVGPWGVRPDCAHAQLRVGRTAADRRGLRHCAERSGGDGHGPVGGYRNA